MCAGSRGREIVILFGIENVRGITPSLTASLTEMVFPALH